MFNLYYAVYFLNKPLKITKISTNCRTPTPSQSPIVPPNSDINDEIDVVTNVVVETVVAGVGTKSRIPLLVSLLRRGLSLKSLKSQSCVVRYFIYPK